MYVRSAWVSDGSLMFSVKGAARIGLAVAFYSVVLYLFCMWTTFMVGLLADKRAKRGLCMWCCYPLTRDKRCSECNQNQVVSIVRIVLNNARRDAVWGIGLYCATVAIVEPLLLFDERRGAAEAALTFQAGSTTYNYRRSFPNGYHILVFQEDGGVQVIEWE
jgi:hypothetical protein